MGAAPATSAPTELFFSEYIEGSSNNKALEIYNGTGSAIDLTSNGFNVQMFFNGSASAGLTINLTGTVANGDVFVLAQASASATILAQADQTNGAGWFNGDDAIVLRRGTTVVDSIGQIGFDPGTEWGTGLTSTADNTLRRKVTVQAGDPTTSDAFDPAVEWDGFAVDTFGGLGSHTITDVDTPPSVSSTTPANNATGVDLASNISVNFNEAVSATGSWYSISCATSGPHTATQSGGPQNYILDPVSDFVYSETCSVTVFSSQVVDQDGPPNQMAADHTWSFTAAAPPPQISEIQGASHTSPFVNQNVAGVEGIVTAIRSNGFYMQDPTPDADDSTSDGILVFTSSGPSVLVGDAVRVSGRVTEFGSGTNLTITELAAPLTISVTSSGNSLPAATVIGIGGRIPPSEVIDNDSFALFDPAQDGIDFYESLEGMRVQVSNAVAVGPTNDFGEIPVLADNGANASVRTTRGGIVIRPDDFNPERIFLDDVIVATPAVNVSDTFPGALLGVMDYSFGNFKFLVTTTFAPVSGGLTRESTEAPRDQEIAVATFNVENLDPGDADAKFQELAGLIVTNLRSPDLVALEEVQDNDGPTNTSVTDPSVTYAELITAIQAAGGPVYQYRQIDPVDDQDGGEPGGNIRVGFLFRTDRGLEFIARPGGTSTNSTAVVGSGKQTRLLYSPGRIDPTNTAWNSSRKPLVGEFTARGKTLFVIANHFNSKGGDQPLFGRFQPPARSSEVQRAQQATLVRNFVASILAADPNANVIVLGDLNDFEFSNTVTILENGGMLNTLIETLPQPERYSYVFEGNSQALDHILVSDNPFGHFPYEYDIVHVNAEFEPQASDHDPQLVRLDLTGRPAPK